ncbi:MAG: 3'(2'),5'-bisphosphate nucleotidase CysQ [Spirochaetales bacterium]|nr:3'(2'),5'-bisphosphate nucleotidase CysQ [Spirochaetales bacterium]
MEKRQHKMREYLKAAIDCSLLAGEKIMDVYKGDFIIEHKKDNSPLTIADRKAHELIKTRLTEMFPGIPLLSEEGKEISFSERSKWADFWLVDPLDGTKEFIKRNGEFTVNIALIEKGHPALGVVYAPDLHILYFAAKSLGAYKCVNIDSKLSAISLDEIIKISQKLPVQKDHQKNLYRVVVSRSHMNTATEKHLNALKNRPQQIELIPSGSAIKICLVAEGFADEYPRLGPTMEWDTGAAHAIALEAGVRVTVFPENGELTYNKEDLTNPFFVVK